MAEIRPFRGIRFDTKKAGSPNDIVAPPYDVISPAGQDELYARSQYNVVRIDFAKASDSDTDADNRYTRSAGTLGEWLKAGVLVRDPEPCIYYYRMDYDVPGAPEGVKRTLTGIICMLRLAEWDKGVVLPHERTLKGPKEDRLELMKATGVASSQIFSLYSDPGRAVSGAMETAVEGREPYLDVTDDDGARHRAWAVSDHEAVQAAVGTLADRPVFIADGHHRYETALAYRDLCRESAGTYDGEETYNFVPMVLSNMDEEGLTVLPTHRLINDVSGVGPEEILERASEYFVVTRIPFTETGFGEAAAAFIDEVRGTRDGRKRLGFYYKGSNGFYLFETKPGLNVADVMTCPGSETLCSLDVTILHTLIIERIMGIDTAMIAHTQPVKFEKDGMIALKRVAEEEFDCCFLINPTKVHEVSEVALAGEIMPQKSTYFYPKLLTGLVIAPLKD